LLQEYRDQVRKQGGVNLDRTRFSFSPAFFSETS